LPAWLLQADPYVDRPGSDARIPLAQRRALMELDRSTCRWPVGDPADSGFFFCGGRVAAGRPYCPRHCARGYRGPGNSAARNN
jgi:GcrA cell cycle regulator